MNTKHTVLVVDDQPENLAILGELLETHYRVKVANSGQRALHAALSEPRPDLILLDVMMPDMDGYQLLARLQESPATRDIPVIFVTAKDRAEDEERGLELGAADYITKPIKPVVVLARVRTQLENKSAKDWLKDQNVFLESEVLRRMHDNELIQNASLHALATLAETRDADTGGHIFRTQSYVELLGGALRRHPRYQGQLSEEQLKMIVRAAPLHDIGKVGIPDQILRKPGKLTADEFEIMKTHSQIGGDAIALAMQRVRDADRSAYRSLGTPLAFLEVARQIARSHHERWDGSGYPDHAQGEAIPLAARIMALADVFDALTSARVYKKALPVAQAVADITAASGKHFDPFLVDTFLELQDDFARIAHDFADER
ncbi:MAG: two-component system response regulator [Rhodoferax sp.]